jgi:hypothetical protein
MFDAAVAELREAGFVVERRDYRFGRITTEAMDVSTVFEPWRQTAGAQSFASEATLGHLRRRVAVLIDPRDEAAQELDDPTSDGDGTTRLDTFDYRLLVEVVVERAQKPTQRLSGTAQSQVFAPLEETPPQWRARGIEQTYWEPIGRDEKLEDRLLRRIVERAVTPPAPARTPKG